MRPRSRGVYARAQGRPADSDSRTSVSIDDPEETFDQRLLERYEATIELDAPTARPGLVIDSEGVRDSHVRTSFEKAAHLYEVRGAIAARRARNGTA